MVGSADARASSCDLEDPITIFSISFFLILDCEIAEAESVFWVTKQGVFKSTNSIIFQEKSRASGPLHLAQ